MELFSSDRVAEGYAQFRPRFHPEVIDRIRTFLQISAKLPRGLDIGCGTGLSTAPLMTLAQRVVGVDAAGDMVAHAESTSGADYLVSAAERLPFRRDSFDIIAVSGAINWIDRREFLPEANRLLRDSRWLVVYDGAEMGAMVDGDEFSVWYRDAYLARLPRPPRDERTLESSEAEDHGFALLGRRDYALRIPFELHSYVGFLLTQSNTTDAVERRGESLEAIEHWLTASLRELFGATEQQMLFGGYIWYLQKTS